MAKRKASTITDRAKRYRANRTIEAAGDERRCSYCGNPEPRDVEHINGDEGDTRPQNLTYACRSCNAAKGAAFARSGLGVRTIQFNPSSGATSLGQYMQAVMVLRGESDSMSLPAAIKLMHNTSAAKRSEFAHQIWDRRRKRAGDVPF